MPRAALPVLLTVFLDLVGFGIVIPLLPFFAESQHASAIQVTLLMACYSMAQFLFAPLWGALSDRYGRRPILLMSVLATAACLAGFASATSLAMLFLFRTLHGACAANVSTAQAAMADLTTPENRAKGMGMIGAAFGVGFSVGPWLGGEMSAAYGMASPFWLAAAMSLFNFGLALAILPETRHPGSEQRQRPIDPLSLSRAVRHPVIGLCILLTFVLTLAFAMMESTFTLFGEHVRSLTPRDIGRMFGVAGLVMILIQGGVVGRLAKKVGEHRLIPPGILLLAIGLFLLPLAPAMWPMTSVFILMSLGQGLSGPSLQALVSKRTPMSDQGFVLGANQSMGALARAVGPGLGGLIYTQFGPSFPFRVSSGILLVGLALSWPALRRATAPAA